MTEKKQLVNKLKNIELLLLNSSKAQTENSDKQLKAGTAQKMKNVSCGFSLIC